MPGGFLAAPQTIDEAADFLDEGATPADSPVVVYPWQPAGEHIFLHLDGADLSRMPLADRKQALAGLVEGSTGAIRYSEHLSEGEGLFKHACLMGLEGIISKRADRPYRSGRYDDWLKIKCVQRQEFVVTGYLRRSDDPKAAGALVLGVYDGGKLTYVGRVGTGFTASTARALWIQLQPLRASAPSSRRSFRA
jgi:bifunctional non-homologous end joining protein LigD